MSGEKSNVDDEDKGKIMKEFKELSQKLMDQRKSNKDKQVNTIHIFLLNIKHYYILIK